MSVLVLIIIFICLKLIVSRAEKIKRRSNLFIYWAIVILIPIWFFFGHFIYPSYFQYKRLCESEAFDDRHKYQDLNTKSKSEWLVQNRLKKYTKSFVDSSGEVVIISKNFKFYRYTSRAKLMGFASGTAPSEYCH